MDWIHLAYARLYWQALVNAVMNFKFSSKTAIFCWLPEEGSAPC